MVTAPEHPVRSAAVRRRVFEAGVEGGSMDLRQAHDQSLDRWGRIAGFGGGVKARPPEFRTPCHRG